MPHHVTQRGNRGEQVFFNDDDRRTYLAWLNEYANRHGLEILAYCLMTNHVHLVAVPVKAESLQRTLRPLHMRYAQRINRLHGWMGHLWQGRFFSSALDGAYLLAAVRYVERNPVRANLVGRAERYRWSSAATHCGLRRDPLVNPDSPWHASLDGVRDWRAWLADADPFGIEELRRSAVKGAPCGSDTFIADLEEVAGRNLRARDPGRPGRKRVASPFSEGSRPL